MKINTRYTVIALAGAVAMMNIASAQPIRQTTNDWRDAFRQLEDPIAVKAGRCFITPPIDFKPILPGN